MKEKNKMNKEAFIEELREAVKEMYPEIRDEDITVNEIRKDNDRSYMGFLVRTGMAAPTFNVDAMYEEYMESGSISKTLAHIKDVMDMPDPEIDIADITSYEKAKKHLTMFVRDRERNSYMLGDVPYVEKGDFVIMFKLLYELPQREATITIKNENLDMWGITAEELYEDAKKYEIENKKPVIKRLEDVVMELQFGMPADNLLVNPKELNKEMEMLVLTNELCNEGASMIANDEIMEKTAKLMGGSFYIIPSSIHECLAVKGIPTDKLNNMIKDVNDNEVEPGERLSYKAQFYDAEEKILMNAKAHEEREKFKAKTEDISKEDKTGINRVNDKQNVYHSEQKNKNDEKSR